MENKKKNEEISSKSENCDENELSVKKEENLNGITDLDDF